MLASPSTPFTSSPEPPGPVHRKKSTMLTINLKELPSLGSDEGVHSSGADLTDGDQHSELVRAIAGVSVAGRSPERQAPTPVKGFATTGGWGLW